MLEQKETKAEEEKLTYYEYKVKGLNEIPKEEIGNQITFIENIDFSTKIKKDADAEIIKSLEIHLEGIKEKYKHPENRPITFTLENTAYDLKKDSGMIIQHFAEYLLKKYCFKALSGTKADKIFIYEDGIYKPKGKDIIRQECEAFLKDQCSTYKIKEVTSKVSIRTLIQREALDNIDENFICLDNGIFDLRTMELKPHDKDIIFFTKIPVSYNPEVKCSAIEKFIEETFYEEDIPVIYEWMGFQLLRRYLIKKAVILAGEKDTGKTTFLNLMHSFIGKENISDVSLQKISKSPFSRKALYNKHSNICDELSEEDITDLGTFKMATGGGVMGAEEKFGDDFGFYNYAKMTFACNKVPKTKDIDDFAYYSRWIFLRTDNRVEEIDPYLKDKLTTKEELSGLLNIVLPKLKNLTKTGKFSYTKTDEEVRDLMVSNNNPLVMFVQGCLNEQGGSWISKQDLYSAYLEYTAKNKLPRTAPLKFSNNIVKYCKFMTDQQHLKNRGWGNVRVNGYNHKDNKSLNEISTETPPQSTFRELNDNELDEALDGQK